MQKLMLSNARKHSRAERTVRANVGRSGSNGRILDFAEVIAKVW